MPQFDPNVWKQWTPQDWIDEAIGQYVEGRQLLAIWNETDYRSDYEQAANCTQRSIAAAAIATAKMTREIRNAE